MSSGGARAVFVQRGGGGGEREPPEPPDSGEPEPGFRHSIELKGLHGKRERPSRTLLAPALALLARLGGTIRFDEHYLRPYGGAQLTDLGAAVVSYAALLTWLFDDPRMYRYGKLRHLGSQLAEEMGVNPLRYRLNRTQEGRDAVPILQLSPIELGSAKFLQTLALISAIIGGIGGGVGGIVGAAADGPAAWQATQDYYLPMFDELVESATEVGGEAMAVTGEFLVKYFAELETVLAANIKPEPPEKTPRGRSGSYPIRTKQRGRIKGS